ncbi:AI-2E family transporter [Paraburkholderia hayleyella]|uniref:AI-2E family transporter n=1 Tax=Paraburkholderia hayleyella TaxID=2152889 RepID=UPI001292B40A|nr:AI-2E family transporter [Paraburkholderia hayleyella]
MSLRLPVLPNKAASPNHRKMQHAALAVLYTALVLLAVWVVRDFIRPVVWAAVVAIALWPLLRLIEGSSWFRGRATLIAGCLTLAVSLLLLLPLGIGIAQASNEAHDLIVWFRTVQENGIPLPHFVEHLPFGAHQVTAWWQANLAQPLRESPAIKSLHGAALMTFSRHFGMHAAHGLMLFGFMLVTLFIIFRAGSRLSDTLLKGACRAFGDDGAKLVAQMAKAVRGTVSGLVVVGLGEGLLLGVAYILASVPHAALLGLITALAAMLPFCAPLTFCAAALWLLLNGSLASAIALVVFGFVVVFIAEHFVRPVLIGNSARLPFLLVLFGILGGAQTFGLLGLFIGPALMTVLMVLWSEWVRH